MRPSGPRRFLLAKRSEPRPSRARWLLAAVITISGFGLLCAGAAMVYVPAGFVTAGVLLLAAGLFGIDVGRRA